MKTTVVYHSADFDGIFCREIARKFLHDAELIGWDYGDPTPAHTGNELIYMLDISVVELMGYQNLIWIDHHKSAMEKFAAEIPGYRIDGVAACRLAWQWFYLHQGDMWGSGATYGAPIKQEFIDRKVTEPLAVRLAGEYDIWDHRGDGDLEFQFGLDSQEAIPWKQILNTGYGAENITGSIVADGRAAMRCYAKRDADVMRTRSFTAEFEGVKFLCLNTARCNSNTFSALDVPATGHDGLLAFYWTGRDWSVSLYHAAHRKDLDLSLIAVKHGGGGHRGACGFRAHEIAFLK